MILFLIFLVSTVLGEKENLSDYWRVIGGGDAEDGAAPHMASLQYRNGFHFCGSAIIHQRFLLTAGHCFRK